MKKYMILLAVTLIGVIGAQCAPEAVKASAPVVSVSEAQRQDIALSVFCTGKVGTGETTQVTTQLPVVAHASVAVGDRVAKGDVIAEVDAEATLSQLAALYSLPAESVSNLTSTGQREVYYAGQVYTLPETVTAPIDGSITQLNMEEGQLCGMNTPLAVISGGDGFTITANINEAQIAKVAVGQRVIVTGSGFSGSYEGQVKRISGSAKQVMAGSTTETVVETVFVIDNPDQALKPGFTAKVEIIVDTGSDVLLIPYESLCREGDTDYVYLAGEERAVRRDVLLGREVSQGVEVLAGLEEGDLVVTNPSAVERSGAYIRTLQEESHG